MALAGKEWWETVFFAGAVGAALTAGIFTFAHQFQKFLQDTFLLKLGKQIDFMEKEGRDTYQRLESIISTLLSTLRLETDGLISKPNEERAQIMQRAWAPLADLLANKGLSMDPLILNEAKAIQSAAVTYSVNARFPALANPEIFTPPETHVQLAERFGRLQQRVRRILARLA